MLRLAPKTSEIEGKIGQGKMTVRRGIRFEMGGYQRMELQAQHRDVWMKILMEPKPHNGPREEPVDNP